jgi:diguanylate cyclase (GGDEF)-like protein
MYSNPPSTDAATDFAWLMEAVGDAVFILDRQGVILFASRRANALTALEEPRGVALANLISPSGSYMLSEALNEALYSRRHSQVSLKVVSSGAEHWVELQISAWHPVEEDTRFFVPDARFLVVGRSISRQVETEERLRYLANHDALTGLPNRTLLSDRIRMSITHAKRTGSGFSILALDLDGFKKINDALGHPVGDMVLQAASDRLRETLRGIDTLARVGGDEFIAVLPDTTDEAVIQAIAGRMITAIQSPFSVQDYSLYVSTSVGAAIFPQHGDNQVKLLAHADNALYRAKETGKSRCVIYNESTSTRPDHDVLMEADMFEAVRNGDFLLHYQPIVDANTAVIMGFEVLMRWMHPDQGFIPPNQFIPMAESNGLINLLGAWALRAACMQLKRFEDAVGRPLYVSVNVSPRQFRNEQFLDSVDEAISLSGLQNNQLLLEITEGMLMSDPEHAEVLLTAVAERGVGISIDDFGTGYSSLAYLKRFPITSLKIDQSFIRDLPDSVKDAAICNVVMSLASHLNLTTVAEGVENEHQLAFLATHGCALVQGYHTGRPLPPEAAMEALIKSAVNNRAHSLLSPQ